MSLVVIASWASIIAVLLATLTLALTDRGRRFCIAAWRVPRALRLGLRLRAVGITNFYENRDSLNKRRASELIATIRSATYEVGVVAISFQRTIVHQGLADDIVQLIRAKPELTVRFALIDPNSPMVPHLAASSNRTEQELRDAIRNSLRRLREAQREVNSSGLERLLIRTCEFHLFSTIVAVDVPPDPHQVVPKSAFFLVEHALYGIPIDDRYTFEVTRHDTEMFSKVLTSYRKILALENLDTPAI